MISLLIGSSLGHHRIFKVEVKFFKYISSNFDVIFLKIRLFSVIFYGLKNTAGRCHMAYAVDQDHFAESLMFLELVKNDLLSQLDLAQCDLIFLNVLCGDVFSCVDIDLIFDAADKSRNSLGSQFDQILFSKSQLAVIHPEQCCSEAFCYGELCLVGEDAASADIHFFVKLDGHCLSCHGFFYGSASVQKGFDSCSLVAWKCGDGLSDFDLTALNLSLKSTEFMVRTADSLYRHVESCFALCLCHIDSFQMIQKCFACVPWHVLGFDCDVVSFCRADRNDHNILKSEAFGKFIDIFYDLIESFCAVAYKVHLVDCKYKMMDPHQGADAAVTSCLYQNALFCIDKDDRKLCKRSTNCHISRIFFMSRCICDDEASLVCCKITISNINGDTLFSLCHQTIQKK